MRAQQAHVDVIHQYEEDRERTQKVDSIQTLPAARKIGSHARFVLHFASTWKAKALTAADASPTASAPIVPSVGERWCKCQKAVSLASGRMPASAAGSSAQTETSKESSGILRPRPSALRIASLRVQQR